MTCGTEIPVVGGLCPSSIGGDSLSTVLDGIRDGQSKKLGGDTRGVISKDSKGSECKSTIADTIPITLSVVRPPAVELVVTVRVGDNTLIKTIGDHVLHDLALLVGSPNIVQPVICDSERSSEFCGIKEVSGVPLGSISRSKGVRDGVLWKGSVRVLEENASHIPEAQ